MNKSEHKKNTRKKKKKRVSTNKGKHNKKTERKRKQRNIINKQNKQTLDTKTKHDARGCRSSPDRIALLFAGTTSPFYGNSS